MSGRPAPPERYAGDRTRARSRSPPRRDDRDRGGARDVPYSRYNPNNDPSHRPRRDYDDDRARERIAYSREDRDARDGGVRDAPGGRDDRNLDRLPYDHDSGCGARGGYERSRGGGRDVSSYDTRGGPRDYGRPPPGGRNERDHDRPSSRGGYGRGYGRHEGRDREREHDYDRPLDRRAIEEGRRRREEERAKGVVFTEDGAKLPAPEEMSAEPSPAPEVPEEEQDEEAAAMAAMLGFGGFGTTKGKPVEDNIEGGAKVHKQRTWRQYMNRRGGFNRPLDKMK